MAFACLGNDRKRDGGGGGDPKEGTMRPPVAFLPNVRGADEAAAAATEQLFGELRVWLEDTLRPLAAELEGLQGRVRRCEETIGLEVPAILADAAGQTGLMQRVEALTSRELKELREWSASEVAKARAENRRGLEELKAQQAQMREVLNTAEGEVGKMRAILAESSGETNAALRQDLEACQRKLRDQQRGGSRWFCCSSKASRKQDKNLATAAASPPLATTGATSSAQGSDGDGGGAPQKKRG
mmetsp:Transcript_148627/g.386447  ORF Transcript_148627/g.386447 Transcript_148627/m.386447 type:complete len:243 (+) Transcript_148627:92-820(+)